jgi:hypothetical protein
MQKFDGSFKITEISRSYLIHFSSDSEKYLETHLEAAGFNKNQSTCPTLVNAKFWVNLSQS